MDTQWRWAGFGQPVGLDYSALETVARLAKVEMEPSDVLLADLGVMERAALKVMADRRQREASNRR